MFKSIERQQLKWLGGKSGSEEANEQEIGGDVALEWEDPHLHVSLQLGGQEKYMSGNSVDWFIILTLKRVYQGFWYHK